LSGIAAIVRFVNPTPKRGKTGPGTLSTSDYRELFAAVTALVKCDTAGLLERTTMTATLPLLRCDTICFNDMDLVAKTDRATLFPEHKDFQKYLPEFECRMHEHPVVIYQMRTGDGTAWKITDFMSQSAFRKTALYRELYAPLDTEYQMAISFQPDSRRMIGLACNRARTNRDFTGRERELLNLLRPILQACWRRAGGAASSGSESPNSSASPPRLTKRERQIQGWLAEGLTNAEIGSTLGVSAWTVKTHVQKLLRKLRAKNRTEAAAMYLKAR